MLSKNKNKIIFLIFSIVIFCFATKEKNMHMNTMLPYTAEINLPEKLYITFYILLSMYYKWSTPVCIPFIHYSYESFLQASKFDKCHYIYQITCSLGSLSYYLTDHQNLKFQLLLPNDQTSKSYTQIANCFSCPHTSKL